MKSFVNQHILNERQFNRKNLETLFERARELAPLNKPGFGAFLLQGQVISLLFYEPSTRTRFSFEAAAKILGAWTLTSENTGIFSSAAKGETLEDTIKVVNGYSDLIILRHPQPGSAKRAVNVSGIPIINAGDGTRSHPTQALLDLFTIEKEFGKIDGVSIAFVGDLAHYRAARSLCAILTNYKNIKIYFVAPKNFKMKDDIKRLLKKSDVKYFETEILSDVLKKVDIVYMTRTAKEYFENEDDYLKVRGMYIFKRIHLGQMRNHGIVMHPLPRVGEIDIQVDKSKKAAYFRQAKNGVAVRMALLSLIIGKT
ncbi:aspartate carbamoyltransferase [Patescibacteria group bacterium]|nr:aspartate carbamoyltransferase [Patescibacteria group bacterium]